MDLRTAPIIDKTYGPWYFAFNPVFGRALRTKRFAAGNSANEDQHDFTSKIAGGIEYYGNTGPATEFDPINLQEHQIFPTIDLNVSPKWEFNFGVGWGLTPATDHLIVKCIVGRRFSWTHDKKAKLKLPQSDREGN